MATALTSIVITTDDIQSTLPFYVNGLDLAVTEDSTSDPSPLARLWGLGDARKVRSLVLRRRRDDRVGFLRLTEISGANGQDIREAARTIDHGILTMEFGVADNAAKVKHLRSLGFPTFAGPQRYDFDYYRRDQEEAYYVIDSITEGPNHVKVDLLERHNAPFMYGSLDPTSGLTEYIGSAIVVPDMPEALRFFGELLGIPVRGAFKAPGGPHFQEMLKIPPTEGFDWSFVVDVQSPGCFLELLRFDTLRGSSIAAQRTPLNYGAAILSFAVDDINRTYKRLAAAGTEMASVPMEVSIPGVSSTEAFACYAPAGILCEVYGRS